MSIWDGDLQPGPAGPFSPKTGNCLFSRRCESKRLPLEGVSSVLDDRPVACHQL